MKQVHVILLLAIAFISEIPCQKIKDEDQAYEFGFTIDGQQHRHEKKDVNGIIMGEFGFITADGIYHVTVYATDENGNFKILKMRNIRISPPLDGSGLPEGSKLSKQPTKDVKRQTTAAPSTQLTTTTQPPPLTTEKGKPACASCSYITTEKPQPDQKLPALTPQKVPQYPQNNVVDRFGSTDQPKPFGENQASGGNPQSPFGGNQAIVGGNQPSFGGNQQGFGENQPPFGSNQPSLGGNQPLFVSNQPPLGEVQPPLDGNQPSAKPGSVSLNGPQEFVGPYKPSLGGGDQTFGSPPNQEYVSSFQNSPQTPNHVAQIQNRNPQIEVTNTSITVPGNDPIPITDRYPGMVDGLPEGIKESDVSDLLYKFNYTVGFHGHYEKGLKNGAKIGGYYVNYRDGSSRVVTYVADEYGYRPKVKFVRLGLDSPDTPKEATEKTFGLKSFEFVWYPLK